MSKTKTKSAPKEVKSSKSDILTKVKGSAVTKPAQTVKAKSKDIAKQVATKEGKDKKNKKVPVKEPTPEPSSEEEDSDASSDESESDSEAEVETKGPVVNGKKAAKKDDSSDDDEESDSDESASEAEAPTSNGATSKPAAAVPVAAEDSDDDSSDESASEADSDDEANPAEKTKPAAAATSDEDSDEEEDDASDSDDSDESEESDSEEKPAAKSSKRKAQDDDTPVAKKSKVEEAANSPNLFVGNLSWNVDEDWLRQEFEEFGELSGVRLMTDRATGRSKGFGYVEFVNAADAAKAHAAKQGAELDGRALNVDFANPKQSAGEKTDDRRKSFGDQVGEPTDTLFLGNLSFECTNEEISAAFSAHGTIMSVRLPTDRETGNPKGFGYVTFSSIEEATGALEAMQGSYIARRPVRVDYSQPRQNTGDSPARGGFGGRGGGRGFGGGRGGGFDRGRGRGGGRGDFRGRGGDRGGRGGRGASTNRGGFGDFSGRKTTF